MKDKGDEEITVKKAAEYMACIHGTYWKAWEDMKQKEYQDLAETIFISPVECYLRTVSVSKYVIFFNLRVVGQHKRRI